jgi:hypothetical protein
MLLRTVPWAERRVGASRLLESAEVADRFRLATARLHPDLGNGSLGSAAMRAGRDVPVAAAADPDFLHALATISLALVECSAARIGGADRQDDKV